MAETSAARRWRALIEAQASSGLSDAVFAQQQGINRRTLAWWRSMLRRRGDLTAPAFTELAVTRTQEPPAPRDRTVVLALDRFAAHVVVDDDTDLLVLRRLLEAVA